LSDHSAAWISGSSASFLRLERALALVEAAEGRQRLAHHLVHIIITVSGEPAHEGHPGGGVRERLVALEQRLILRPRDRVIRIALAEGYS
jgi:hypothetical protein